MINTKKGFTLVELLIVIGILAILTAAVVVILNPAELLKQARDSTRFSDLDSIKNALALYLTDVTNPVLGTTTTCNAYVGASATNRCGDRFSNASTIYGASTTRVVSGTGWIPVNFNTISGGSPLTVLPVDPSHNTVYFYAYSPDNTNLTFELNANLESAKYASKAANSADGGNATSSTVYEVGTDPGLDL